MPYGVQPPRRRDAQRNRAAIVRAATEAMTGPRSAIEMREIARRAGVGLATLYRHFPNRYALAAAVIARQLDLIEAFAAGGTGDPALFRPLLREMLRVQVAMRPLVLLVRRGDIDAGARYLHRMIAALTEPFREAQRRGYIHAGRSPDDLALVFAMVEGVLESTRDARAVEAAALRSIDLVLDGLFATGIVAGVAVPVSRATASRPPTTPPPAQPTDPAG